MALVVHDFESGTDGNPATLDNTGAVVLAQSGGNAISISSESAVNGANSMQVLIGNTTNSSYADMPADTGTNTTVQRLVCVRLSPDGYNNSGGSTTLWQQFLADNTTTIARLSITNAGQLQMTDQSSAHTGVLATDVTARYGNWIFVRIQLNSGTTTSNGTCLARYYTSLSAAVGSFSGTEINATNWSTGAGGSYGRSRIGVNSAQASLGTSNRKTLFDYYAHDSGLGWVASPAAAAPPTANAGPDQYGQSGATFTLAGSGTVGSGGGSINGYTWTNTVRPVGAPVPSISNPNAANPTVSNIVDGEYIFSLVVTQTGGALSSPADTMSIWVTPLSGQTVKPKTVTKDIGISRVGTATTDVAALTDASSTSGFQWPANPAGEALWITWNPIGSNAPTFDLAGLLASDSDPGTIHVSVTHYFEDGTSILWGPTNTDLTSTTERTLTGGLSSSAVTALGSAASGRRALKTKITMSV